MILAELIQVTRQGYFTGIRNLELQALHLILQYFSTTVRQNTKEEKSGFSETIERHLTQPFAKKFNVINSTGLKGREFSLVLNFAFVPKV